MIHWQKVGSLCKRMASFCTGRGYDQVLKKNSADRHQIALLATRGWSVWMHQKSMDKSFLVLGPTTQISTLLRLETLPYEWICWSVEGDALGLEVPATINASLALEVLLARVSHYEIDDEARTKIAELTMLPPWKKVVARCTLCFQSTYWTHQLINMMMECSKYPLNVLRKASQTQEGVWQVWIYHGALDWFKVLGPTKQISALLGLDTLPREWGCQKVKRGVCVSLDVPTTVNAALKLEELLGQVPCYKIDDEAKELLSELTILDVNAGWYDQ